MLSPYLDLRTCYVAKGHRKFIAGDPEYAQLRDMIDRAIAISLFPWHKVPGGRACLGDPLTDIMRGVHVSIKLLPILIGRY